jgi:hypothetical protein
MGRVHARMRGWRDLLLPLAGEGWDEGGILIQSRAFRPQSGRVTFLSLSKEKLTKRKTPRRCALRASCPLSPREASGRFDGTSVCRRNDGRHPVGHPSGYSATTRRNAGAPKSSGLLPALQQQQDTTILCLNSDSSNGRPLINDQRETQLRTIVPIFAAGIHRRWWYPTDARTHASL